MSFNLRKNLYCPAKAKEFYEGEEAESSKQVIYALVIKYFAHRKLKTSVCTCTDQHNIVLPAKKKKIEKKKSTLALLLLGSIARTWERSSLVSLLSPCPWWAMALLKKAINSKQKRKRKLALKLALTQMTFVLSFMLHALDRIQKQGNCMFWYASFSTSHK